MAFLIHLIALAAAILALALAVFLVLEVAAALLPAKPRQVNSREPGQLAVIVPAHNEAGIIMPALECIKRELREGDRLIVVADNCTDDTADIAVKYGAECLIRNDPNRVGKGFALQFALDALRAAPPEIIVFLDADCIVADGSLRLITAAAAGENRPVQALYLMKAPENAEPKQRVAEFAWLFINRVRMLGLQRLFDVTRFTGAGLAAPWSAFSKVDMGSGQIVEDLALTFELIRQGNPPFLLPDAIVTSEFPASEEARLRQSARWSIGSLAYAFRSGGLWLIRGILGGNKRLAAAAVDLAIPPLTLLIAFVFAVIALSSVSWLLGNATAMILATTSLVLIGAAIIGGWLRHGRAALPASALLGVIRFAWSKSSVFGSKGRSTAKSWTPTRNGESDDAAR